MRRLAVLATSVMIACSGDGALGGEAAVAEVGPHRLTVDRLAEIMVAGRNVPLALEVAERLAHRWIEFAIFTSRTASGDSLLDSALVLRAMWPEVNQAIVDAYQARLIEERLDLSDGMVDSAYAAGNHRLIKHVLIRVSPTMSAGEQARARRRAERIHAALERGGDWERANQENEDPAARAHGGSLGVIGRGQMLVDIEDAAFALNPGGLSPVVETSLGYHVMYRPRLQDVRVDYTDAVRQIMAERIGTAYLSELVAKWEVSVRPDAAAILRQAAEAPLRAMTSTEVLGTHRQGKFTVADFVRWLQVLPLATQQQVTTASNDALLDVARSMIRNEALVLEARAHGIALDPATYAEIRMRLADEIDVVRRDIATAGSGPTSPQAAAERYVIRLVGDPDHAVVVPTFLADALRRQSKWRVSAAALSLVVERARLMRIRRSVPQQENHVETNDTAGN